MVDCCAWPVKSTSVTPWSIRLLVSLMEPPQHHQSSSCRKKREHVSIPAQFFSLSLMGCRVFYSPNALLAFTVALMILSMIFALNYTALHWVTFGLFCNRGNSCCIRCLTMSAISLASRVLMCSPLCSCCQHTHTIHKSISLCVYISS